MITAVQERMAGRDFWSMRPVILVGDKAAVLARRVLQNMIKDEKDSNAFRGETQMTAP